jgi:hypothetical protein
MLSGEQHDRKGNPGPRLSSIHRRLRAKSAVEKLNFAGIACLGYCDSEYGFEKCPA